MPLRRLALFGLALLLLALGGAVTAGVVRGGWEPAPKLALDLEGGTQVILQARTTDGSAVDAEAMEQARQIMSQRINAMGVAETEISVQSGSNIVVDVPGTIDQATSDALRQTAMLSFRPVLGSAPPEGEGTEDDQEGEEPSPSDATFSGAVTMQDPSDPNAGAAPSDGAGDGASDGEGEADSGEVPAWSMEWITPDIEQEFMQVDCTDPSSQQEKVAEAEPTRPVVVCDPDGQAKYVLGPETVPGSAVRNADSAADTTETGQPTGGYAVNLQLQEEAGEPFLEMTTALNSGDGATDAFAMMLDGQVISSATVETPTSTEAKISGDFTQEEAEQLADQLRFGALPLQFDVQSEQQISATLGTDQLEKGLIAGLIGLALVVIYAAVQYRVLSIVTTSSLLVMGTLAYLIMTVLSHIPDIGYRLSLAGVVGLIVSIAFTADSFIVYFERVRDEIREGRGIVAAVDHGWDRAKRTILASDTVNLIASVVLYTLSTGGVRGFAFTLGLATLLDLLVVFCFTHPLLQSLVRTRFFGKGHPASGLDPQMLGRNVPAYAGRGRVRTPSERSGGADGNGNGNGRRSSEAPPPRETLAARKARQAREAQNGSGRSPTEDDVPGEEGGER